MKLHCSVCAVTVQLQGTPSCAWNKVARFSFAIVYVLIHKRTNNKNKQSRKIIENNL